MIDHV